MPAYNETLDLVIKFGTKWQSTPGLNLDTEIADLEVADAGHLGQGQLIRWPSPASPRPRARVPHVGAGVAAGALGLPVHRAVAHRVRALHGVPDDRHARLHAHEHQPRAGRAAPLRRPRQLRRRCSATGRRGTRCSSRSSTRALALPVAVALPLRRRPDAPLAPPAGLGRLPRPVLPAVRRPVRRRRPDLGRDAQPRHAAGSTLSSRPSASSTRRTGSTTRRGSTRAS